MPVSYALIIGTLLMIVTGVDPVVWGMGFLLLIPFLKEG